ncbi:hypothetical protein NMY22_g437 [Coprinellus aureogranulatus]|nr:hypothetical protein NMY22_g437 [Coprinellus aureogranulatus]
MGIKLDEKILVKALVAKAGNDFTESLNVDLGRTLGENYDVVATREDIHFKDLAAVQKVETKAKSKI